jgi:hypothetical protein
MTLVVVGLAASLLLGLLSFILAIIAVVACVSPSGRNSPLSTNMVDTSDHYYWVAVYMIRNLSNLPESERADAPEITNGTYGIPVVSKGGLINTFNLNQVLTAHFDTAMVAITSITEVHPHQNRAWQTVLVVQA